MPQLTTNYSESLAKLLRSNDAPIDGIEVGPWFTPAKIKHLQQEFSDLQFQFHAGSFITRYQYWPGALSRLFKYLACTQSQWVSLHIELLPVLVYVLSSRLGLHLTPPKMEQATSSFIHLLLKVKEAVELPLILENLPSLHHEKYTYAANPSTISAVIRTTDSGFLLDIAHARVAAASYQGMSVENYLEKLPLERTTQIHVSGARVKDGYLQDTHEAMQDEDYAILKWVLEKSRPKVVTLEYFRELQPLREQLWKLREIIAG
jgi:uncharacterized protein (UPF0276 family)